MRQFQKTAVSIAAAHVALCWSAVAMAQSAPTPPAPAASAAAADGNTVVVTGQRAALQSAQKIKRNAEEVVDSIVAEDIGKLPDRSVTEVLQRVVGVTIDRTMSKGDPEHYSVEGSGVSIRGLPYVRSELNGRDSFSANGGRSLSFEDVPPELMSGVDVYKNPSAEQIEGAIGGLVNLRTAMPFDFKEFKGVVSVDATHNKLNGKNSPSGSLLLSNVWDTDLGKFGALIDVARSKSATRTDGIQVDAYYQRTPTDPTWIPKAVGWRTMEYERDRQGIYGALQWKKDTLQSSLTAFESKYKFNWAENALFGQANPYNTTVDAGATYSASGALLTGTIRDDVDGGIGFDADTRYAKRDSSTRELAWNTVWTPNDRWRFTSDFQFIRAKTQGFDSTVATGLQMAKETLDLSGPTPRIVFDAADLAALANPANYYWAFTMDHADKSVANQKAWKGDVQYKFDDPVLVDLRFGLRLTDRDAKTQNSNPSYNWATITHPWQKSWDVNELAYLSNFGTDLVRLHTFDNFMNGNATVAPVIVPNTAVAAGYPNSYDTLHGYYETLCAQAVANQGYGCFNHYKPSTFGTDPSGDNDQRERTQAAYAQLRFGFDDWKFPVDGHVGLRLVHTANKAHGYFLLSNATINPPAGGSVSGSVPTFGTTAAAISHDNSYTNVLPSLNLKMKADEQLQFRMAWAQAISRPDFSLLQDYTTMKVSTTQHTEGNTLVIDSVNFTGTASGNPLLKPIRANQLDLTAEWYFAKNGSLTFAAFNKQLKDIIVNQTASIAMSDSTGTNYNFTLTSPVNGAKGFARGFEVAYQQYFDTLPGWLAGFGVQANYTYVNSKQTRYNNVFSEYCTGGSGSADNLNLNINGCDTNGKSFSGLPLNNVSRDTINLALLYDRGPLSARIAYSWRSKYLYGTNMPGTQGSDGLDTNPASATYGQHNLAWGMPLWADAFGQIDAGVSYKFDDRLTVSLEGQNLNNAMYKQMMQQTVGMMGRSWYASGPRYTLRASYSF